MLGLVSPIAVWTLQLTLSQYQCAFKVHHRDLPRSPLPQAKPDSTKLMDLTGPLSDCRESTDVEKDAKCLVVV